MPSYKRKLDTDRALVELHRGSYVTERALSNVLKWVRDNGMPTAISRAAQYRAKENVIAEQTTPYGKVLAEQPLKLQGGREFMNYVEAPAPMLHSVCKSSEPFRQLLRQQLERHPCSMQHPWRICLYFDGISPRDPLAKGKDYRGVDAVYWSFLEFNEHLSKEDAWFCATAPRVAFARKLPGGISQLVANMLHNFFFSDDGFNFQTQGVILDISDAGDGSEHATLVAKLACTIADEEALRELHMNKGHAGRKPCAICRNMVNHRFDYSQHDATGTIVSDASLDPARWTSNSDHTVLQIMQRLRPHYEAWQRGEISYQKLDEHQTMHGWNFNPNSIVMHPRLKYPVISNICFDWMHVWCVDGVFAREMKALLACKRTPFDADDLHAYVSRWSWPRRSRGAGNTFETGEFAGHASDVLSVAPLLAKYVSEVVPEDVIPRQRHSFLLCCKALDMVAASAFGIIDSGAYRACILEYLAAHQAAYGTSVWAYKHHMSTHLPEQYSKFGGIACFVHERKHKTVKKFSKDQHGKARIEKNLMMQLIAQHQHDLEFFVVGSGLEDPVPATQKLVDVIQQMRVGTHAVFSSTKASSSEWGPMCRGEMVLMGAAYGHSVGHVFFHVDCDPGTSAASGPLTLLQLFQPTKIANARTSSEYVVDDDAALALVPTSDLRGSCAYRRVDNKLTVAWPFGYQMRYRGG